MKPSHFKNTYFSAARLAELVVRLREKKGEKTHNKTLIMKLVEYQDHDTRWDMGENITNLQQIIDMINF